MEIPALIVRTAFRYITHAGPPDFGSVRNASGIFNQNEAPVLWRRHDNCCHVGPVANGSVLLAPLSPFSVPNAGTAGFRLPLLSSLASPELATATGHIGSSFKRRRDPEFENTPSRYSLLQARRVDRPPFGPIHYRRSWR
jgi:hypothetical protein